MRRLAEPDDRAAADIGILPLFPASLPVLVLGGELDTWTPAAGVPKVLSEIGGHARFVELANSTHVVGEGDTACGSTLVQAFVADPQALDSLDASCAPGVSPIHTVGRVRDAALRRTAADAGAGQRRAERGPATGGGGGEHGGRRDRALRGDRSQARPRPERRDGDGGHGTAAAELRARSAGGGRGGQRHRQADAPTRTRKTARRCWRR